MLRKILTGLASFTIFDNAQAQTYNTNALLTAKICPAVSIYSSYS